MREEFNGFFIVKKNTEALTLRSSIAKLLGGTQEVRRNTGLRVAFPPTQLPTLLAILGTLTALTGQSTVKSSLFVK